MKKNDLALIILIASIALAVSYFVAKAVIGDPQKKTVQVDTIELYSSEIRQPDASIFNPTAINPTVEVNIGNSSNKQPF